MAPHPQHPQHPRRAPLALAALLAAGALALLAAAPALAAPLVKSLSFSGVTTTAATLEATIDPNGAKVSAYRFQYTTLAKFKETGFTGAAETPNGPSIAANAGPTPVAAEIGGLEPATAYRFRLLAESPKEKTESPPLAFATYAVPLAGLPDNRAYEQASPVNKDGGDLTGEPSFVKAAAGGDAVSFGATSGIPGGEGTQQLPYYLATRSGEGAGAGWATRGLLPPASLAPSGALLGWTPDFSRVYQQAVRFGEGEAAALLETRPGDPVPTQITPFAKGSAYAFAGASSDGSIAVFESRSAQLGTAPAGVEGRSNVYAWDADTQTLSLAGRLNSEAETEAALPGGAFAGPYGWANSNPGLGGARALYYTHDTHAVAEDGSVLFTAAGSGHLYQRLNPTQPQSAMGGKECTEPTKACTIDLSASHRSAPDPGGPQPAAFHYASADGSTALFTSPEKLTDDANTGPEVPPPAIGRLTLNGSEEPEAELDSYFPGAHGAGVALDEEGHVYSVDPNEGTIDRATLTASGPPIDLKQGFVDVAAKETCAETRPFLEPGVKQCGHSIPRYLALGPCAEGGQCLYWTNTGPLAGEANNLPTEEAARGAGTIGRAKINPESEEAEDIEPAFITGASNPQGIAVNSEHIFWANSLRNASKTIFENYIGRAGIEGDQVEQRFFETSALLPYGVALSSTRVYFATELKAEGFNVINSISLEGGSSTQHPIGQFLDTRGVAIAGNHLYWADQASGVIGRMSLADVESSKECSELPTCEPEFITPGGSLFGLAADAPGSHLYWTANGEVPPHPGNDLYRHRRQGSGGCEAAGGCLDDLTADAGDENGAEVLGVVGASADASRVYFVANGVLSEAPNAAGEVAAPGTCHGKFGRTTGSITGHCNLYLWEGGQSSFLARLDPTPSPKTGVGGDSTDWVPTLRAIDLETGKSAFASADGTALLFKSQERLTEYDNEGVSELYLYRLGQGIACVSCLPTGAPPAAMPTLGSTHFPLLESADVWALASRNLSADGQRAFFESTEALVADDTDASDGCPLVGTGQQSYPSCRDVYEWEAPGAGSCEESSPSYSPQNQGCLYLISRGQEGWASILADASQTGDDVFFYTRSPLVGQDADQLLDVYDARVGGGIASQSPSPREACEGEACKPATTTPPAAPSPATAGNQGPGNVRESPPPRRCPKGKVRRHGKCVKKSKRHHNQGDRR